MKILRLIPCLLLLTACSSGVEKNLGSGLDGGPPDNGQVSPGGDGDGDGDGNSTGNGDGDGDSTGDGDGDGDDPLDTGGDGDGDGDGDATGDMDAGMGDGDSMMEYCAGEGPPIEVPTPQGDVCAGVIARQLFTNAICTCANLDFGGLLDTESFSARAGGAPLKAGAPVGVNGQTLAGAAVDVGGSLRMYGSTTFAGALTVHGDLEAKTDLLLFGLLGVGRDAWLEGNATLVALSSIGRDLHHAGAAPFLPPIVGRDTRMDSLPIEPPCPCQPDELLDIDGIIADGKVNNHNAEIGLDPNWLVGLVGLDVERELPCGRYFLNAATGLGGVTLTVNGRTALYIEGDVANIGIFNIDLGPQGELDIFIGGNLAQVGANSFGNVNRPSGVRVYVGGDQRIVFAGLQPFGGNLYAPRAELWSAGAIDLSGSIFVDSVLAGTWIDVDYDLDILEVGDENECLPDPPPDMPEDPPMCQSRCENMCGVGQACVNMSCGGCMSDADCCSPLICNPNSGSCEPLFL